MPVTWVGERLRTTRARWHAYDTMLRDRWLAVVFTGLAFVPPLSMVSAQFGNLSRRPMDAFAIVLVLAQTLPLAVRSRWPAACLAVVGASFAIHEVLGYPPQFSTVTAYLAVYSAGTHQERLRPGTAVAASVAYLVVSILLHALGSPNYLGDFLVFYLVFVACWLLGAHVRRRRAEEVERRRRAEAAAAAAERAHIARELHDVVTHHVTAAVVQAEAAQFLTRSPDQVVTALSMIAGAGRQALAELRYLLDVLESTGESTTPRSGESTTPHSTVEAKVRQLVEQIRMGGQPVDLIEDGDRPTLPAAVGLAVYRVVQEGLTNAIKHAAGQPTLARVSYRTDQVMVEVTNATAPAPPTAGAQGDLPGGRGLIGLRERIATLGGELTARAQPDGQFRLRAVIPWRIGRDRPPPYPQGWVS